MKLAEKTCAACRGDVPPLKRQEFESLLSELQDWRVENDRRLVKRFLFDNFKQAMELAIKIGELAEEQRHHPDLLVRWGELKIELWTHKVDGLTENDFVLAAKIDQIAQGRN